MQASKRKILAIPWSNPCPFLSQMVTNLQRIYIYIYSSSCRRLGQQGGVCLLTHERQRALYLVHALYIYVQKLK
jgi:hypothetical protein